MTITVKRQTGLGGSASKLAVYIDGEKVGRLANRETAVYDIDREEVELQVGQSFVKSKPIRIKSGQTALAKFSPLGSLFSILGMSAFYLEIEDN